MRLGADEDSYICMNKDYDYRYSVVGKANWERLTGRSATKLFQESLIDGEFSDAGLQDFLYIMTYHQNKGATKPQDIDVSEEEYEDVVQAVLAELNRWIQHKNELLKKRAEELTNE